MKVMFGHDIKNPADLWEVELDVLLHYFKTNEFVEWQITDIRAEQDKDKKKALKSALPYLVGGLFDGRRHTDAFKESSLFVIDIDHIDDYEKTFAALCDDGAVLFAFRSPSGDGIKVGVKLLRPITSAAEYSIAYRHCAAKFAEHYGVQTDKTCDAARACFFSWDEALYYNPDCSPWMPKTEEEKKPQRKHEATVSDADKEWNKCAALAASAFVSDYHDWVACGMALKNKFGDRGFDLFKSLSLGKGTDDNEQGLWKKWQSFPDKTALNLGSFVVLTKKWGGKD